MNEEPSIQDEKANTNPYASPSIELRTPIPVATDASAAALIPPLPITFRPSFAPLFIMIPIGAFMALVTLSLLLGVLSQAVLENPAGVFFFFAASTSFTAIPAFGCLMVLRCKILISESSVEKTDLPKKTILFSQIRSWHSHPVTKTVYISFIGSNALLPISNWAMTQERNEILAAVLRAKVGPPSNNG